MRFTQVGGVVVLVLLASGCANRATIDATEVADPSSARTLPCRESDQEVVTLDVPGPGQLTAEEAVAPYADSLELVSHGGDAGMIVVALRGDGTVVRIFDATKREDGWWPDGYRECSS